MRNNVIMTSLEIGEICDDEDLDKLSTDLSLLTVRLMMLKKRVGDIHWYDFWGYIMLLREIKDVENDIEKLEERFHRMIANPIRLVRRV